MSGRSDCIFCKIADGDATADIVHRSEYSVAFRDLSPQAPVHVLVIPRRHIVDAADLEAEDAVELADLFVTATQVAEHEGVRSSGFRLLFNVGADATNTVPHLHLHMLGGRGMGWPPG